MPARLLAAAFTSKTKNAKRRRTDQLLFATKSCLLRVSECPTAIYAAFLCNGLRILKTDFSIRRAPPPAQEFERQLASAEAAANAKAAEASLRSSPCAISVTPRPPANS